MKVLVAEDEVELANVLVKILRKNNYSVDVACDGEEALLKFEQGSYDVVLLDVMMPKIDGIEVLKIIRKNDTHTPILMLTAKTEIEDKVLGLDSGANDYLGKPFDTRELLARIRNITRQKEEVDNKIRLGNISLNRKTFELEGSNKNIKLTNKEFQMMEILMKNRNIVISTEQFMDKVWSDDLNIDNNVVWVYVSYLRKKLNMLSANIEIKSKRNLGYYLEIIDD